MKKLVYIIICLMTANACFSQQQHVVDSPFDPNVIPQTPERGKFPVLMENFSVDYFTGQPNIEIPLYTINAYDIQVPIALKYRSGGLRVDVEDSYLGLNWDLIAGGEIRRTVVGLPDELHTNEVKGYHYINENISGYPAQDRLSFINALKDINEPFLPALPETYFQGDSLIHTIYNEGINHSTHHINCEILKLSRDYGPQYSDGRFDTGPDIYNFNIMGLSGTFTTNTGIISGVENLQSNEWIDISRDGMDGFTIKDSKGYTYIFKEQEWHRYKYRTAYYGDFMEWQKLPMKWFDYVTTWKLSEIQSPGGETVSFHYESHDKVDLPLKGTFNFAPFFYVNDFYPEACDGDGDQIKASRQSPMFSDHADENLEKYTYKYLTRITATNTRVDFNYLFFDDYFPKLNTITVYVSNDYGANVLKKFELNNASYYSSISSIKEYGSGNNFKEYKFLYYQKGAFSRFETKDKDHWGYYSPGANEFASGIYNYFKMTPMFSTKPKENPTFFGNRDPRIEGANDGMLRQIIYPTGAKVSFNWEFHDYSKRSTLLEGGSMTDGYFNGHEITYQPNTPAYHVENRTIHEYNTSATIDVVKNGQTATIDLSNYYPHPETVIHNCDVPNAVTYCNCIEGWDGNEQYYSNDIPYLKITGPDNFSQTIVIEKESVWKTHDVILGRSGNYKFELFNAGKELIQNSTWCYEFYTYYMDPRLPHDFGKVGISTSYHPEEYNKNNRENTFFAGGVRIKEIVFEGYNNSIRKLYNYSLDPFNPKSPSSGVLTKAPRYSSSSLIAKPTGPCPNNPVEGASYMFERFVIYPNALPQSTEPSGHIEYSHVTEFTTNQPKMNNRLDSVGNTGVTMYEFCTSADGYDASDINDTQNVPYVPNNQMILTSMHFNRGQLRQKTEYTNEVKTTRYLYSILEKDGGNVPLIPATLFSINDFSTTAASGDESLSQQCPDPSMSNYLFYKDYGIVRYRIIPYNKRISEIEQTGTVSDNYQKFTYPYSTYSTDKLANSPVSELTINSKGDNIVNYYTYTDLNKVHTCVTVCNDKIIAAYRNEYDPLGNLMEKYIAEISPSNYPEAANYQLGTLKITSNHPIIGLTNKLIETRSYEHNRLCELINHQTDVSTVYIWGYNGEYPIAEIKNCTLAQRNALLSNYMLEDFYYSQSPLIGAINALRNSLPESQITTLTYKMKVGVTSVTDPRGVSTYYDYDEFGWLKERYIMENGQKKIVQKEEYHWNDNK